MCLVLTEHDERLIACINICLLLETGYMCIKLHALKMSGVCLWIALWAFKTVYNLFAHFVNKCEINLTGLEIFSSLLLFTPTSVVFF